MLCEKPCGRDRRTSEIEYLFSASFPLVGSPQRLAEERILPTCSGTQERFWTDPRQSEDKSQNDRNKELRQRPQGAKFIKSPLIPLFQRGRFLVFFSAFPLFGPPRRKGWGEISLNISNLPLILSVV